MNAVVPANRAMEEAAAAIAWLKLRIGLSSWVVSECFVEISRREPVCC